MSQTHRHVACILVIMIVVGAPLGRTDDHVRATAAQASGPQDLRSLLSSHN
jgi:hypothetical protein